MKERARLDRIFWPLWGLSLLWSLVLLVLGFTWMTLILSNVHSHQDWQWISGTVVMIVFLPLVLLGTFRPRLSVVPLYLCSAVPLLEVLGLNSRTGEGTAFAAFGNLALIGIPALLTAFLFRWRARYRSA